MNMSLKTIKIRLETFMVGNNKYDPCKPYNKCNSELIFADKIVGGHHVFLSINDGEQYILFDKECSEHTLIIDECGKIIKFNKTGCINPKEKRIIELQSKIYHLQDELDCLKSGN